MRAQAARSPHALSGARISWQGRSKMSTLKMASSRAAPSVSSARERDRAARAKSGVVIGSAQTLRRHATREPPHPPPRGAAKAFASAHLREKANTRAMRVSAAHTALGRRQHATAEAEAAPFCRLRMSRAATDAILSALDWTELESDSGRCCAPKRRRRVLDARRVKRGECTRRVGVLALRVAHSLSDVSSGRRCRNRSGHRGASSKGHGKAQGASPGTSLFDAHGRVRAARPDVGALGLGTATRG
jgi:hypothetical protein